MSETAANRETLHNSMVDASHRVASRLVWLDIVRMFCALLILGIHWLRACFKVGSFGDPNSTNLVMNYQGQSKGLAMLPHILIAGVAHSLSSWLTDLIGIFGGFGWEGVSALIVVSGFSLTVSLKNREPSPFGWLTWFKKRAVRILLPFYIVAIPFLLGYVALLFAVTKMHGTFAIGLSHKLHTLFQTSPLGVIFSHTILINPLARNWQPDFFAPAWWFIPAILVTYAIYPFLIAAVRRLPWFGSLGITAIVTIASYELADVHILDNEQWYFIVLQELFNLTLGIVAGNAWLNARHRPRLESIMFGKLTFPVAFCIFAIGNIMNWMPTLRPFASMLYGPGLTLMLTVLARHVENWRLSRQIIKVDAYDLYLVHQPFAFPLALAARIALHEYAVFVGWFVFVAVATIAALGLSLLQRLAIHRPSALLATTQKSMDVTT